MKKIILSLAILLALFSSSFANRPDGVTDRAAASFHNDFHRASEVSWAVTNNYILATFSLDKETLFAYYDYQGNLIGVIHHILTSRLREDLQKEIKKRYSGYWVSELFQVTTEDGVYYFIRLNNADETIVLSTEGSSGWHRYCLSKYKI